VTKRCWSISPFFNELDVLEVKLAEQAPWVDRFVFSEATTTYAGNPKPLYLTDALAAGRFAEWADKITVVVVDDAPTIGQPFQTFGDPERWRRENHQRACLARGLGDLEPDDVVCLSDLDEIVRGSIIRGYADAGWTLHVTPWEAMVVPIPQYPSMNVAIFVADSRSPDTPLDESPSKNIRSPARDASATITSDSYSERHRENWSSGGIEATMPRYVPPFSIVAMSIVRWCRTR